MEKIKKKFVDFFESLGPSLFKFNDFEAISKWLTALLKRQYSEYGKNQEKIRGFSWKFEGFSFGI